MKYLYLFIALIFIINGLTVHAIPHGKKEFKLIISFITFRFLFLTMHLTFELIAEYTKRGESCKTTADCSDGAECNDGVCTSSVHPDCCWMPPIYCCGPLKSSP
ncbi:hypothetical protein F8M41_018598 [Gigaspora margarita]|uniref:Uncharacterized protein n=1 Tax=Gigaspora margarita TaxID=4874 RepID=A0A8H4EL65_GIGMA|nr:hypothetical protein F8M41_018598 [Gigaspora margarita]